MHPERRLLFALYAPDDAAFVRKVLLPRLALPAEQVLSFDDFTPGSLTLDEISRAVQDSKVTVVVLSPAYLRDRWAVYGEQLASHAHLMSGKVLPLLLTDCQLPLRLDALVPLDFRDPSRWHDELERLARHLGRSAVCASPVTTSKPIWSSLQSTWRALRREIAVRTQAGARSSALARAELAQLNLAFTTDGFVAAALNQDVYACRLLLEAGICADAVLDDVARAGCDRIVALLVEQRPSAHALGRAFIRSAHENQVAVLEQLLDHVDLTKYGSEALWWAALGNHGSTLALLLRALASARVRLLPDDPWIAKTLERVVDPGRELIVEQLLALGANPNSGPLLKRCFRGPKPALEVARRLLAAGADVQRADSTGDTALHLAIQRDVESVRLLLQHGANPHAANRNGHTPVTLATDSEVVQLLHEARGADTITPPRPSR